MEDIGIDERIISE